MIVLYGALRKQFGKNIDCKVNSVNELMKAAEALRPGFKNYIQKDRGYVIRRGSEFRQAKELSTEEVEMRFGETDWHIVPMPMGYGGFVKVILGIVMIVVGAYTQNYSLVGMGAGMLLGGVSELLAPSITTDYNNDKADERASFLFNGPTNRVASGNPVPLVYGFNVFVGSIFLSGGLEVGDLITAPSNWWDGLKSTIAAGQ